MTQPTHSRRKMLIASVSAGLCALVHAESSKAAEVVRIIVGFPPGQQRTSWPGCLPKNCKQSQVTTTLLKTDLDKGAVLQWD